MTDVQLIDPRPELADFWSDLAAAPQRVLMTDYDGVIAPFHADPLQAVPHAGIPPLLDSINRRARSRVVIVTGRPVREVVSLLQMTSNPEVWGSHGFQRLSSTGEVTQPGLSVEVADALRAAQTRARAAFPGDIEAKPFGVAMHWRSRPAADLPRLRAAADELAGGVSAEFPSVFVRHDFDGGVELLVAGRNKGVALTEILEPLGPCRAAYLGDDVTDEDAFVAAPKAVLTVLVRPQLRTTAAAAWIDSADDLLQFLHTWDDVCAGRRTPRSEDAAAVMRTRFGDRSVAGATDRFPLRPATPT